MKVTHSIAAYRPGHFLSWPANNGAWIFEDGEILCAHFVGGFKFYEDTHSFDRDGRHSVGLTRSFDGGLTWETSDLDTIYNNPVRPVPEGGLDFSNPDFCLRVGTAECVITGKSFIVSNDRGHTWDGPYALPDFGHSLTCRTAYLINGPKDITMFLSKNTKDTDDPTVSDRSFTVRSKDGCLTWEFLGYMADDKPRNVMPDIVRLNDGTIVAALRRRLPLDRPKPGFEFDKHPQDCFIETRISKDGGCTWTNPVRIGDTGTDNGNPPAITLLPDGRIVVAYGRRSKGRENNVMCLRISKDGGISYEPEIIFRDDAVKFDFGYPRLLTLGKNKVCCLYYYNSVDFPEMFIASSIIAL